MILTLILGLAINIPIWIFLGTSWVSILASGIFLLSFLFILRFFRYPERYSELNPGVVYSPADGKIIAISEETETEYFKDSRIIISIFMSALNIHANWLPISGHIKYTKYHPGRNLFAIHPKSSHLNERCSLVIKNENDQEILVRQVAGILARRVVTYPKSGDIVEQGQELGFIKFGSRLDIILPLNTKPLVEIGDKVMGNLSKIAAL